MDLDLSTGGGVEKALFLKYCLYSSETLCPVEKRGGTAGTTEGPLEKLCQ